MANNTNVEIISRDSIKPSSPTPPENKIFKLSLLDQVVPPMYTPIILFYTNTNTSTTSSTSEQYSKSLKNSLSKTLVQFYPFAGTLKDNTSIECNDQGAYFIKARIDLELSDFLNQPNPNSLNQLLPTFDPKFPELANNAVLLVQLTEFSCGGLSIAVSSSHKIADMSSLCAFMKSWTASDQVEPPVFVGGSLLPAIDLPINRGLEAPPGEALATRRLVFDVSKLEHLKAKLTSSSLHLSPTNVELVTSILLRISVISGSCRSEAPSVLFQGVNLRKRMVPPLPENAVGNLIWGFPVSVEDNKMELVEIVVKMRNELKEFCDEKANRFRGEEGYSLVFEAFKKEEERLRKGVNTYSCTSLCKFPLYQVDFGWGKPTWVTSPMYYKNVFVLMDTELGEGIEAWVTLEEQQMSIFESNEELLSFASLRPYELVL